MDSTVAVQTNGFGSSFQAAKNSTIAHCRSSTLLEGATPDALGSEFSNHRSPRFNQLELVWHESADEIGDVV